MFKEFKQLFFQQYNTTVETQRVVNMNQQAARTECNQVRAEALDNLVICDDERDRVLG